jgi:hypothetical protein
MFYLIFYTSSALTFSPKGRRPSTVSARHVASSSCLRPRDNAALLPARHLDFQRRDLLMSHFRISSRFYCSMSCSARDRWPSFYYDVLRRVFCKLALCLTLGLQGQVTSTHFAFRDSSTLMLTHGFDPVPPRGPFSFLPCPSLPSLPLPLFLSCFPGFHFSIPLPVSSTLSSPSFLIFSPRPPTSTLTGIGHVLCTRARFGSQEEAPGVN